MAKRLKYGMTLHTRYKMNREEWLYCGLLLVGSVWAIGLGLLIGFLWVKFL